MSEDVRSAAERLLIDQWRVQAWTSNEEGRRIHRTIHATTDAEERCYARAEIWIQCADELEALLASLVRGEGHEEQKKEKENQVSRVVGECPSGRPAGSTASSNVVPPSVIKDSPLTNQCANPDCSCHHQTTNTMRTQP